MIENLAHSRILGKKPEPQRVVEKPVVYEDVVADMYEFQLPCGPQAFAVEVGSKKDYFKKDMKEKEYRIGQTTREGIFIEIVIPFTHVFFFSKYRRTSQRAVSEGYQPKTK